MSYFFKSIPCEFIDVSASMVNQANIRLSIAIIINCQQTIRNNIIRILLEKSIVKHILIKYFFSCLQIYEPCMRGIVFITFIMISASGDC